MIRKKIYQLFLIFTKLLKFVDLPPFGMKHGFSSFWNGTDLAPFGMKL